MTRWSGTTPAANLPWIFRRPMLSPPSLKQCREHSIKGIPLVCGDESSAVQVNERQLWVWRSRLLTEEHEQMVDHPTPVLRSVSEVFQQPPIVDSEQMHASQRLRQVWPLIRIFERREDRIQNLIAAQPTLAISGRPVEDTFEGPPIMVE